MSVSDHEDERGRERERERERVGPRLWMADQIEMRESWSSLVDGRSNGWLLMMVDATVMVISCFERLYMLSQIKWAAHAVGLKREHILACVLSRRIVMSQGVK